MAINGLNSNFIRLTGMSSGMDTTAMVTSLLQLDQMKVDKQFKAKTTLEWKGDAYREFNLKLRTFRETYMSVLSPSSNVFSASAYNAFAATMVDETQSKYVSVSAGSNASACSMTIQSIDQLATAAQAKSTRIWDVSNPATVVSLDTTLGEAPFLEEIDWNDREVDNPAYLDAIKAQWVEATDLQIGNAGFTKDADHGYFINPANGNVEEIAIKKEEQYIKFSVNGTEFDFTSENTLNEMISKVNSANVGVVMGYSSLTKGFTFTARSTGAESEIVLANVEGNMFGEGAIDPITGDELLGAFGIKADTIYGQNSKMTFLDDTLGLIEVERSSNSFAIDGIQYTLKQVFNKRFEDDGITQHADFDTTERIQFNVERDIEPVFQKLKGFIDGYNALIAELQNAITKKPNKEYLPLTDSERSQLSETESKKWEDLAKEGLLYRDSNISSLLAAMRGAFYDGVKGVGSEKGRSASDIGLRTPEYDYTAGGKIVIDEEALRSALANNPEQVKDIFTKVAYNADGSANYGESGLVVRISNAMNTYVGTITDVTLQTNSRQLREATNKLEDLEGWIIKQESRYWAKFTAMETAMAKLNSQTSWISTLLGGNAS